MGSFGEFFKKIIVGIAKYSAGLAGTHLVERFPGGIKIFSGTTVQHITQGVCEYLNVKPGLAKIGRHNNGEPKIQLIDNVRDADVYIVCCANNIQDLFEMAVITNAVLLSSAARITGVFLGDLLGNRQDRKDKPRAPITAKVVFDFISSWGLDRAIFIDIHSEQTIGLLHGAIPDHLYASFVIVPYLKTILQKPFMVASPDAGGVKRAEIFAKLIDSEEDIAIFSKGTRPEPGKLNKKKLKLIGDVKGKTVVLVDDIIDTAITTCDCAELAMSLGAIKVIAVGAHAVFSGNAVHQLDTSLVDEVIITNTVPHSPDELRTKRVKITVLPIDNLVGEAIGRTHRGQSLSALILNSK